MRKVCGDCGREFEAKRPTAKFCSAACRVRANRRNAVRVPVPEVAGPGAVLAATLLELDRAGKAGSASGTAALVLAERIDRSVMSAETGSAVAAMVREHRAALADALADVQPVVSPLDELRLRRERRVAAH